METVHLYDIGIGDRIIFKLILKWVKKAWTQ